MKGIIKILCLVFLLVSCAGNDNKSQKGRETLVLRPKADTNNQGSQSTTIVDSVLYSFSSHLKSTNRNTLTVKYAYEPDRDTLVFNPTDSVLIFKFEVDTMINFYKRPFHWTSQFRGRDSIEANIERFIIHLSKASFCQGIIYDKGNQYLESFSFSNEKEAIMAKQLFDNTNYYVFPKTLSFASHYQSNLYVFHARYNGASWYSKKDFEKFEEMIKTHPNTK